MSSGLSAQEIQTNDNVFEQLYDLVDELLKGHFGVAAGMQAEARVERPIPPNQMKEYDVTIVVGGARLKPGKPRFVYLKVKKKASGESREIHLSADREPAKRQLKISLGAKLGVYSLYQGFVMGDDPCEPPKDVKDVAAFRNSIVAFFERFTSLLRDWRDEFSALANAGKKVSTDTSAFDF